MDIEKSWQNLKEYHARFTKQRTDAFNFSLILLGLVLNAVVTLSIEAWKNETSQPHWVFATILIVLAFFIIAAAFLFWGVDYRTTRFIEATEKQLLLHEEQMQINLYNGQTATELKLPFSIDKKVREEYKNIKTKKVHAKFGTLIKVIYIGFIVIGFLTLSEGVLLFFI